jgi:hypothetical protein
VLEQMSSKQKEEWVASCPSKVYKLTNGQIDIEDSLACTLCNECKKKAEEMNVPNIVKISQKTDRFYFFVEVLKFCKKFNSFFSKD